ncbi:nitrilase family protein [Arenibacter sp. GZD96]|uniref:nitrilase family protein n=1 Tax=Aurantibrevibacter litoralis TaxID=3106030 RepID=UPI002AFE7C54|nr:nitrilase family protein [Arenibacter sp. GZD-96]MEA1785627.1 nitrilase family protein [Arenibacter sp. GZD-96]
MNTELHIALLQSELIWESPQQNRDVFTEKITALPKDTDLVILPEMFTTGFTMHPENISKKEGATTLHWMQTLSQENNIAITGSVVFFEDGHYYNRLLFVEPNGKVAVYNKRHTFTLSGEDKVYKAGTEKLIVNYKDFSICPLICYDLRFPVWSRNVDRYDVLLYVANWPKPRIKAWDTLLQARAIENMAYCIGVNRVGKDEVGHEYPGHSAVYGVLGETLAFATTEETIKVTLKKEPLSTAREKLKFLEDKDHFSLE